MSDAMDESRLLELAALDPGDPRRVDAAKDPLVRAWLLEHDAFVAGSPLDPRETGRVSRAVEDALARARGESKRTDGRVIDLPRAKAGGGVPRWALAAAVVAVVAAAVVLLPRHAGHEQGSTLRSLAPETTAPAFAAREPVRDAAGRLVLAWSPLPGAASYRVEILKGLGAVATFEVSEGESLALEPSRVPEGEGLLWRVLAIQDGGTIASTPPRALPR